MDAIPPGFLGPSTPLVPAASLALVVAFRPSICRHHLGGLTVTGVLSPLAFFGPLLAGLQIHREGGAGAELLHLALVPLAGFCRGCASSVGFRVLLKRLGVLALVDARAGSERRRSR